MATSDERASRIFNGYYTIESRKGGHRTLRIATVAKGKLKGRRIVSLLTGPNNSDDYRGFGFVDDDGVQVWKRFAGGGFSRRVYSEIVIAKHEGMHMKLAKLLWSLAVEDGQAERAGYKLLLEARCLRCNRRLTTPESIRTGVGPVCAGRA